MRILVFNYEYPPIGGGGGIVNAFIAEELARRHEVWIITSRFRDLPVEEERAGVRILRVPVWGRTRKTVASMRSMLTYPPAAWAAAARLLRGSSFDIVHGHFAVPTGPGSLPVARLARVPHVVTLLGGDIYNPAYRFSPHRLPLVRSVVAAVLRHSDAVVADSSDTRNNAYRYYRYRGPIDIIPLGIPIPEVPPASRREIGLPEGAFLAVTVGRLLQRKAIDALLRALGRPECEAIHLAVVGEGPERPALERLRGELGLEERVWFTGWVTEERKWQLLRNADLYVSATRHEGFGLVFLEAMASGLPVVCPDHGGQVDFLRHGETGALVPVGDEDALTAAIAGYRARPEETRRIGRANLERSTRYSAERCAADYESLFERLIGERRGRPSPATGSGRDEALPPGRPLEHLEQRNVSRTRETAGETER